MDVPRIGIDPAPGKGLVVFDPRRGRGDEFEHVPATIARVWLERQRARREPLVGWDAPLFGSFSGVYTERPIESFMKNKLGPAVSVRGFAGCPHWTISLDVLGYPMPSWLATSVKSRLPLRFPGDVVASGVVETHPAVALAMAWPQGAGNLPSYKPRANPKVTKAAAKAAVRDIEAVLRKRAKDVFGVPWVNLPTQIPSAINLDDLLDAEISFLCVEAMCRGRAMLLGDREHGGFVVPKTAAASHWQMKYRETPG
jgi:hypothetical protein